MNAHARRCRRDMLATVAAALVMACPAIAQAQAKPPAKGPRGVPAAVAEGRAGEGTVRIRVGDLLSGSTVVRVDGKVWLVTGTSTYLASMEKAVEPELLAGPEGHRKLALGRFRFTSSVPDAMCIEWDLPDTDLERSGITPFGEDRWQAPAKDMRMTASRGRGAPDMFTVTDARGDDGADFLPPGRVEAEGVPFVAKDAPGTIIGIGVRSVNASDPNNPVGRILGREAVIRLIKEGKPVDREALLTAALGKWGDQQMLQGTRALLQQRGYGRVKRWWIATLDGGEWRGKYKSPEGGPRVLAVVPENPADQLDLVLNKPENAGHGEDRELYRNAIVRIGSAGDADGADIIVQSMTDNPKVVRVSSSRLLFLEMESVPGTQPLLPGAKEP